MAGDGSDLIVVHRGTLLNEITLQAAPIQDIVGSGSQGLQGPAGADGTDGTDAVWTEVTQAAYDALSPPVADTLYVVVG